jgi:hypothetical protein
MASSSGSLGLIDSLVVLSFRSLFLQTRLYIPVAEMKFLCLFTLIAPVLCAGSEDGHAHQSCACEAEENGFSIDCSNGELLLDTLATLIADDCSKDCSSKACHKNFLIVQSHHDFCLHDEVPSPVEDAFHDFEEVCDHCSITRKRDPDLSNCPVSVCDKRGDQAYQALLTEGCVISCTSSTCGKNYQILRAEHDNCDDGTISESAETGIHDLEEICEPFNCNSLLTNERMAEQLICTEESNAVIASRVSGLLIALSGIALLML